jgi:hypothetical protein
MKIFYFYIINNKCVEQTFKVDLNTLENLVIKDKKLEVDGEGI